MKEYKAEVFDKEKNDLGEGPFYDGRFKRYSWVDISKGRLWTMIDGQKTCFELGQPLGSAIPMPDSDGFILAAMDGIYSYVNGKTECMLDLKPYFKPYWRCNDAKLDPRGRLFFGAYVNDDHPAEGALYCLDKGLVRILQPDTKISNGMAWSSDERCFFFSDSLEHAVFKYDYDVDTGDITNRRVLFTAENGITDGLCIDGDDNLWVAYWGGHRIEKRSGIDGRKLGEILLPAENVTSCAIAEGGKSLFITTSGAGLDGEFDGCLFICDIGD
ncbi:MAG: SMP-30/gluconolactonase/LRE family protein [Lachnospiraceae bacterium]|nr:SMP-30/gluconolactonase/LRE family protein [Lachnospiraceae bacterium]